MTGSKLDEHTVRDLEGTRKLDRQYIPPKGFLGDHATRGEIHHRLTAVPLSSEKNLALWSRAPEMYLKKILDQSHGLSEEALQRRVASHLVPYDVLVYRGSPNSRYKNFIKQRAKLLADEIARLVAP